LMKEYNENPLFDPTTNVTRVVGKDGRVTLNFVSADDPKKVLSTYSFKNDLEARDFLVNSARNPGQQAEWMSKMRAQEAQARYYEARADYYERGGGLRPGRDYAASDAASRAKALTAIRSELSRDAERLRDQLSELPKNDPNREAITRQLNDTLGELRQVDSELRGYRAGGGGGLSRGGGTTYKSGETYEFADETGKPQKYKFKGGDSNDLKNWEQVKAEETKAEPKAEPKAEVKEEPKEDTKKYIRRKNPRGGWIYEESSRGLTKAQYAEIDKTK